MASLILVVNVVGELQRKRTLAASRGFLAAARLSCTYFSCHQISRQNLHNDVYFYRAMLRINRSIAVERRLSVRLSETFLYSLAYVLGT